MIYNRFIDKEVITSGTKGVDGNGFSGYRSCINIELCYSTYTGFTKWVILVNDDCCRYVSVQPLF